MSQSPSDRPFDFEECYQSYLAGLLTHDSEQCRASFQQWLDSPAGLRSLYEDLVKRSLYEVGDRWERGLVSVATEHLATAVTESLLNLAYPRLFAQPRVGKSVVVTATANEHHQMGAKMVADFFELKGWRGYFLGANMPFVDLLDLIRRKSPDAVALSLTLHSNLENLVQTVAAIRAEFADLPMLVGGQAFQRGGQSHFESLEGVEVITSLEDLEGWIENA